MANTPSSNGKGSARRRENLSKVRENWDQIDWSKGRAEAKSTPMRVEEVLAKDYTTKTEQTIPAREELLGEIAKEMAKPTPPKISQASFFLHYDPHLTIEENDLNEQMQEDDLRPY